RDALARARARVGEYAADRGRLADDLVKKILIYTLLMRGPLPEAELLPRLLATPWFPDTVHAYYGGAAEAVCREALGGLLRRGAARRGGGRVWAAVRP
ncbi:MAG: hypothetical protein ACYDA8_21400, partial [Deferrisomatales bacterium]